MSDTNDSMSRFDSLQAGLRIISELENCVDDSDYRPQLEQARTYIATASRQVETAGFDRDFSKAMGMASSVAVGNGYDELAEDAMKLGGGEDGK